MIQEITRQARVTLTHAPSLDPHAPFPWAEDLPPLPRVASSMFDGHLSNHTYNTFLRNTTGNTSPGPDMAQGVILKHMPAVFHSAALALFRLKTATGVTPSQWLHSHTIQIYKKHEPLVMSNYRPMHQSGISLPLQTLVQQTVTRSNCLL